MRHVFNCDNCGKRVETHCFDQSDNVVIYNTPPPSDRVIRTFEEMEGYIVELFASHMTILCRECITQ